MTVAFKDFCININESRMDDVAKGGLDILENADWEDEFSSQSLEEEYLTEEILTVAFLAGTLLTAPKTIELMSKAASYIFIGLRKIFGIKSDGEAFAKAVVKFADKWHKMYLKAIKFAMKRTKLFKLLKIEDAESQDTAAEIVLALIIFGVSVFAGQTTAKMIMNAANKENVRNLDLETIKNVISKVDNPKIKTLLSTFAAKAKIRT